MLKNGGVVKTVKRYCLYNLFTVPFIWIVYAPYMILYVGLNTTQFMLWIVGGLPWAIVANLAIQPYVSRTVRFLDRKLKK